MKKVSINYPFPVLNDSNDDFVEGCYFNIEMGEASEIEKQFVLPFEYKLNCSSLERMIENKKAAVVLQIESSETGYRKAEYFKGDTNRIDIHIDKNLLGSEIRVKGFIVSQEDIFPYEPDERNIELFGNVPFRVRKNDYLAVSNDKFSIPVDSYDPLADKPSIFSIRKSDRDEEIEIDYRQNKITILINKDLHALYKKYYDAPENRVILASFFAAPALEDTISMMKSCSCEELDQEYGKFKWYQVVKNKLNEQKIDINKEDSIIKIVNKLLPHIFKVNVETFGNMYDQYNSGEE